MKLTTPAGPALPVVGVPPQFKARVAPGAGVPTPSRTPPSDVEDPPQTLGGVLIPEAPGPPPTASTARIAKSRVAARGYRSTFNRSDVPDGCTSVYRHAYGVWTYACVCARNRPSGYDG
jgi:hypothetical protein